MFWIVVLLVVLVGIFLYWQLVITEGTYLGQTIVTSLYDITAHRYDSIKQYDAKSEEFFLGIPLGMALANRPAPLVLDIATGTARLPITLLNQPHFQGRIIGLDHSRKMLAFASKKTRDQAHRINYIWRDAAQLPFPDATFDAVTCLEMLEFTPSPKHQLTEAIRVLRPGGLLVTTRRRGIDARLMPGKTHSPAAFTTLLEELGLIDIRIRPWQVDYDLVWANLPGDGYAGSRPLAEILRCPECTSIGFEDHGDAYQCQQCDTRYPVRDSVVEMP